MPIATSIKVVDASALAAVLFGEPQAEAIAARMRGGYLVAPALLGFEIAKVCLEKIRCHPQQRDALLAAFALYSQIPIENFEVDHADALALAEASGLTFYDAAYPWLALKLGGELVTIDSRLCTAWSQGR